MSLESLMRESFEERVETRSAEAFFAFMLVGMAAVGAFVLLSGLSLTIDAPLPEWACNTCCYLLCLGGAYLAHRKFAFKSEAAHGRALPAYCLVQAVVFGLAVLFRYVTSGIWSLPDLPAFLTVLLVMSGLNFLVLRIWIFPKTGA